MVSATEFDDWRTSKVTQQFYKDLQEVVYAASEQLVTRRQSDPLDDQFLKGFIKGIATVGEWVPELEVKDEA